jgi:sugar-phosphatase
MTVWSVNRPDTVDGSHRHFTTLGQAAPDILAWVNDR